MDGLTLYSLFEIGKHLSRVDCVAWSDCCTALRRLLSPLCDLRLSAKQADVIGRLLSLDSQPFVAFAQAHIVEYGAFLGGNITYRTAPFPAAYCVASGPSTGKTFMALYAAAQLQQQGKRVLLSAPLKLCTQWQAEHAKFAKRFALPPLRILHPQFTEEFDDRGSLLLVPSSVLNCAPQSSGDGPATRLLQQLLDERWDVAFLDEAVSVPHSLLWMARQQARVGHAFHAVSLNASREGDVLASHRSDDELGRLPSLRIEVALQAMGSANQKTRWYVEGVRRARSELPTVRKLLVLSNDCFERVRGVRRVREEAYNVLASDGLVEKLDVPSAALLSGTQRALAVQRFAAAESGVLLAPLDYMARGFNLQCDAVLVLDRQARLSHKTLLQLVGRLRRVESPFAEVHLRVVQAEELGARELGFFPLALTLQSTDSLLRQAAWFERAWRKGAYMELLENGMRKRRLVDVGDRSSAALRALFAKHFFTAASLVQQFDSSRLLVSSAE